MLIVMSLQHVAASVSEPEYRILSLGLWQNFISSFRLIVVLILNAIPLQLWSYGDVVTSDGLEKRT